MEQEHIIIIALLVVALYFLMMRKPCACPIRPSQGFAERFDQTEGAFGPFGPTQNRIRTNTEQALDDQIKAKTMGLIDARIRSRSQDGQGFGSLQHVRNRNHNMYQSQYVRHHLKADHRGKMMNSMMRGEGPDSAGMYSE